MNSRIILTLFKLVAIAAILNAQNKIELEVKTLSKDKLVCNDKSCCDGLGLAGICQESCAVKDYDPEAVVSIFNAKIGDLTTCPVSGVVFEVTANSSMVNLVDKDVYVCCASCGALYDLNPTYYTENIKLE